MLLLAVSGGIDSMCLAEKVRLEGGPFAIAHCNFCLRGAESDADEAFVREWAARYGIPIHVKRFDTQAFAAAEGISVEMAARRLRYRWFGELCREHGYTAVAVAHNANDNAETLILNLLRGTGLRGLMGMRASGFLPDPSFGDIPLLRPLLGLTREDIEVFARSHGLCWREDATNASNDFKRNKIRNLVFPVFREINPSFVQTLNRDMERFAEELTEGGQASESVAARGRMNGRGPLPQAVGGTRSEATKDSGACPSSAAHWLITEETQCDSARVADEVPAVFGPGPIPGAGPGPALMPQNGLEAHIGGPGPGCESGPGPKSGWTWSSKEVDLVLITEEPWDGTESVKQPAGVLIVDADKLEAATKEALLRDGADAFGHWETGDWIRPLGAPGKKKLQDWFTDHHIPADEKPFVPLLKSQKDPHHVLAVIPWCIDHSVRVTATTARILRISIKND